jgi:hypothetical protein
MLRNLNFWSIWDLEYSIWKLANPISFYFLFTIVIPSVGRFSYKIFAPFHLSFWSADFVFFRILGWGTKHAFFLGKFLFLLVDLVFLSFFHEFVSSPQIPSFGSLETYFLICSAICNYWVFLAQIYLHWIYLFSAFCEEFKRTKKNA